MKLLAFSHNRSEEGPLMPLAHTADKMGVDFVVMFPPFISYEQAIRAEKPDVVLAPFDRQEQVLVADTAYHLGIPVCQLFSGDIAGGAFDDADRFVISAYSTYLFCADYPQFKRTVQSQKWAQEIGWHKRIEVVGATHFDDMRYTPCGSSDHTLVLYNPPSTLTRRQVDAELNELCDLFGDDENVVWAEPNGDANSDLVEEYAKSFNYMESMPRSEFLGWLKAAKRIVGNSSCMYYEAPFFDVPIVQVGVRNRFREKIANIMLRPGASKRILEILKEELE